MRSKATMPSPMALRLLLLPKLLMFLLLPVPYCSQRYADRNVLPALLPSSPDGGDYDGEYDDDYNGDYGFPDEDPDVYKWVADRFPHPITAPRFCNRMRASRVCDPDLVLSREQADLLDESIETLYSETPCVCDTCQPEEGGIMVGIALLKRLHHPYHMHHAKVIRSFAESLRRRWKLGNCDNDALIVVATEDRLSYTDVGSATSRHLLSLHEAHRIFLENKSKFSANNFSQGLTDILDGYHRATLRMRPVVKGAGVNIPLVAGAIVGSVLLLGLILFVTFVVYRRWHRKRIEEESTGPKKPRSSSTVSSSWSKKDIRVLRGHTSGDKKSDAITKSAVQYRKCGTDDEDSKEDLEDEMDFALATPDKPNRHERTQLTDVTTDSETLERDLTRAAEGLVLETFPIHQNNGGSVLMTDM